MTAASTGRCNTSVKSLCRRFELQRFTWPFVELTCHFVQISLRVFIVRDGAVDIVEGDWDVNRLVISEFPDMVALRRFWDSEDYQEILPLRLTATDSRIMFVDGV